VEREKTPILSSPPPSCVDAASRCALRAPRMPFKLHNSCRLFATHLHVLPLGYASAQAISLRSAPDFLSRNVAVEMASTTVILSKQPGKGFVDVS
jgi:hypothetical protein